MLVDGTLVRSGLDGHTRTLDVLIQHLAHGQRIVVLEVIQVAVAVEVGVFPDDQVPGAGGSGDAILLGIVVLQEDVVGVEVGAIGRVFVDHAAHDQVEGLGVGRAIVVALSQRDRVEVQHALADREDQVDAQTNLLEVGLVDDLEDHVVVTGVHGHLGIGIHLEGVAVTQDGTGHLVSAARVVQTGHAHGRPNLVGQSQVGIQLDRRHVAVGHTRPLGSQGDVASHDLNGGGQLRRVDRELHTVGARRDGRRGGIAEAEEQVACRQDCLDGRDGVGTPQVGIADQDGGFDRGLLHALVDDRDGIAVVEVSAIDLAVRKMGIHFGGQEDLAVHFVLVQFVLEVVHRVEDEAALIVIHVDGAFAHTLVDDDDLAAFVLRDGTHVADHPNLVVVAVRLGVLLLEPGQGHRGSDFDFEG